jgi:hypothetical protein
MWCNRQTDGVYINNKKGKYMKLILILSFVTALMMGQCSTDTTTTDQPAVETDTTTVTTPDVNGNGGASTDSTATPVVETPTN